ncbi:MAG: response regulator [Candidatus Omnitrophica bacterium]|nr:Chemotaxis response regulator protein-glutamate methylesterase [bacterium]NUN94899.1 response regulator [Candidatus Omnitrophota bacterium]
MSRPPRRVLVVDDNRLYREAIRRNLEFVDYGVTEAEDLRSALERIRAEHPQVVITDLDMSHRTEGLDLIREVKARYPLIPVILVSAVGGFEEGAMARELGATAVISKSRIDEELEHLYGCLDQVFDQIRTLTSLKTRVERFLENPEEPQAATLEEELNRLINSIRFDNAIKGELFDWLSRIRDLGLAAKFSATVGPSADLSGAGDEAGAVRALSAELGNLDEFDPETQTMLLAAERLAEVLDASADSGIARNVGFSYSFAVENEVKQRTGKKFARFIAAPELRKLIPQLYDPALDNLSLGFSRYLLLNRTLSQELTPDLAKQILERMNKHGDKYKADGLKALGVIVYLFGRNHSITQPSGKIEIRNPLGLQGLDEEQVTRLGLLLVRVQHTRNPYIHPEFSEREKLSEMRKVVIECLNLVKKVRE